MVGTEKRTYSVSHPWIAFSAIDLSRAGAEVWMLMGEARSKVEHLGLALLKPEVADEMLRVYLAKGVHATTPPRPPLSTGAGENGVSTLHSAGGGIDSTLLRITALTAV